MLIANNTHCMIGSFRTHHRYIYIYRWCVETSYVPNGIFKLTAIINKHRGEMHKPYARGIFVCFVCEIEPCFCYCLRPTRWSWPQPASAVLCADLFFNCDVCNLVIPCHEIEVIVPSQFEMGVTVRVVCNLGISCHM